jgi:hypothetical protein
MATRHIAIMSSSAAMDATAPMLDLSGHQRLRAAGRGRQFVCLASNGQTRCARGRCDSRLLKPGRSCARCVSWQRHHAHSRGAHRPMLSRPRTRSALYRHHHPALAGLRRRRRAARREWTKFCAGCRGTEHPVLTSPPYDVGYGKPPVQTRFRKGQSGNPKGRGKGSRNFATVSWRP